MLLPTPFDSQENCGSCSQQCGQSLKNETISLQLFAEEQPPVLTEEQERYKRGIYEQMNPRRRKFIDRLGYENWNPFQEPKEPLDIRKDLTKRTLQELIAEFMRDNGDKAEAGAWKKGVMECALGIMRKDEKYQGIFDFCLWYHNLLQKEGRLK